jgi:type II secretory pathway pseudopilin PulG
MTCPTSRGNAHSAAGLLSRAGRSPVRPAPAFTLLEMLVAVGAVALISLGLFRIFGATGDTLRIGRRVSAVNDYSALVERTIRTDIERLNRDGFFVIVNEEVPSETNPDRAGDLAPTVPGAPRRPRRIDQLMFFADGQFTSARTPLHASRVATGSTARVWYGHGLRQLNEQQPPATLPPLRLSDTNEDAGAHPTRYFGDSQGLPNGAPNPNRYPVDWTLLRHVTVLAQPGATSPPRPASAPAWLTDAKWPDNETQLGLGPAQASIFPHVAIAKAPAVATNTLVRGGGPNDYPLIVSGLVDVATTDLGEIRAIILDAQPTSTLPLPVARPAPAVFSFSDDNPIPDQAIPNQPIMWNAFQPELDPNNPGNNSKSTAWMRRWMRYALPAGPAWQGNPGTRVRYQLTPPDYLGTFTNGGNIYAANEEFRRADQIMLASSKLLPSCTEFIVEWSFGVTLPIETGTPPMPTNDPRAGELIWHGMDRYADLNFNGNDPLVPEDEDLLVQPYANNMEPRPALPGNLYPTEPALRGAPTPLDALEIEYTRIDGQPDPRPWRLKPEVIQEIVNNGSAEVLYTTFGYVDLCARPDGGLEPVHGPQPALDPPRPLAAADPRDRELRGPRRPDRAGADLPVHLRCPRAPRRRLGQLTVRLPVSCPPPRPPRPVPDDRRQMEPAPCVTTTHPPRPAAASGGPPRTPRPGPAAPSRPAGA